MSDKMSAINERILRVKNILTELEKEYGTFCVKEAIKEILEELK